MTALKQQGFLAKFLSWLQKGFQVQQTRASGQQNSPQVSIPLMWDSETGEVLVWQKTTPELAEQYWRERRGEQISL